MTDISELTGVAVIGAGIAGLACAVRLSRAGIAAVVLDKGRGIGGRVATRRAGALQFDHGAQYVTARGAGFAAVLADLEASGAAAPWRDAGRAGRIVGTPGMSSLAKGLAAQAGPLDIRQGVQVAAVRRDGDGWLLHHADGTLRAGRVVMTAPAPQVAGLLGAGHPALAAISDVSYDPCLTLMAGVDAPAPFATRSEPDDALAWIAQDSTKPGRPAGSAVAWVAQASPAFSAAHLETELADLPALMLPLLCDRLGITPDRVTHAAGHRWRHARVAKALGEPFVRDGSGTLYLGGDWCLGPRVEAAWDSGTAIATDLLEQVA